MSASTILEIAVLCPLRKVFDYLPPVGTKVADIQAGARVEVPFGKGRRMGMVLGAKSRSDYSPSKLKPVTRILDVQPLLPAPLLSLLAWAADYYHHAPGEVYFSAIPAPLRKPDKIIGGQEKVWRLTAAGQALAPAVLQRAPVQQRLINHLLAHGQGQTLAQLRPLAATAGQVLKVLHSRGWVEQVAAPPSAPMAPVAVSALALNPHQVEVATAVINQSDQFKVFLLEGVTGSGKTEVYFAVIEHILSQGKQALVLVPEINLTPQLVQRFAQRFGAPVTVLHSALADAEQVRHWYQVVNGESRILIGTRLSVFTPFENLGLIVVDEEHDLSYKQQEGFRYHARDVAVMRGHLENIPVILGSATPSLESLHNAGTDRYEHVHLPLRAGAGRMPTAQLVDMRPEAAGTFISAPLLAAMKKHLQAGNQVLLFLNRRGFAPVLLCHDCGWVARCSRCDMPYTWHRRDQRLRCHHCGGERRQPDQCPDCQQQEFIPVGTGTQKVEEALEEFFPGVSKVRIDRDNTRRKGAMASMLEGLASGKVQILVGTQMLAKGHDFPHLTLVGVLDADQGLFSTDFRAGERLAQLLVQVMGRAGRGEKAGEVLIQTHQPDHPLLNTLIHEGYDRFAAVLLEERRQAHLPPASYQVLLRARAKAAEQARRFLEEARAQGGHASRYGIQLLGPVSAPMERRGGDYRYQLLLQADNRKALQAFLEDWLAKVEALETSRKVRWSVDVDPMDMY